MVQHRIPMPDIGEGIAEVEIAGWHIAPGDEVVEDQVLADVMTDKASVQIPSPVAGRVVSLGGQEGEVLAVGATLIVLESSVGAPQAVTAPEPGKQAATAQRGRVSASPSVRRRARELGIDLAQLVQAEQAGPISHHQLDQYLQASGAIRAPLAALAPPAVAPAETQVRLGPLRRQIARKMTRSATEIPHFSYVEEVDITELEDLRQSLNERLPDEGRRLSLLPFIIRAMVLAIRRHPGINAHFDQETGMLTQFAAVHVGVATQTDAGLMVPVLHNAQDLGLQACAAAIHSLSERAREGTLERRLLTGSSITISSLGALGGIAATPIINHPEVAIVGVNRSRELPVVRKGQVLVRRMMNLSSSFDHRVVDGMDAARYIQEVRHLLEHPGLLFTETG